MKTLRTLSYISVPSTHKVEIAQYVRNPNGTLKQPLEFSKYNTKPIPYGHTFFPNGMSYDDIIEQFASALSNPVRFPSASAGYSNAFEAVSESGITFIWYEIGGTIKSFFPKF